MRSLLCSLLVLLVAAISTGLHGTPLRAASDSNDGSYILSQLHALTRHNWARVAGADTNLPPEQNGHDEFVRAWLAEMQHNLRGLPYRVVAQPFQTPGFTTAPATLPGVNEIVVVPGSKQPQQAVIVGAHPDGESWSRGSVFDDASGCAIMLALGRALGQEWRQHGLPSRTVEFVLFDAEEQGLIGSTAYAFALRHGAALPRPVVMFNEEQSGMGYPVRPFGLSSEPTLPSDAVTTPPHPAQSLPLWLSRLLTASLGPVVDPDPAVLKQAGAAIRAARAAAFTTLQRRYPRITYRGGAAPAFTTADRQYVLITDQEDGGSDNIPFGVMGIPTVTLVGDSSFYGRSAPAWAYPFDQPEDRWNAYTCDSGGSPHPSAALAADLELPLEMSVSLVNRYAPAAAGEGIPILSETLAANNPAAFSTAGRGPFTWNFGDGSTGTGATPRHSYARPGTYTVTVRAGGATGSARVTVEQVRPVYVAPKAGGPPPRKVWNPAPLRGIKGCP